MNNDKLQLAIDALRNLLKTAKDHPCFSEEHFESNDIDGLCEIGGDICDWTNLAITANEALNEILKKPDPASRDDRLTTEQLDELLAIVERTNKTFTQPIDRMGEDSAITSAFKESEEKRKGRIVQNPDNGRTGWWTVIGLRHSAIAKASSAGEAIEKALSAGLIGDWECPEASFRTEELPDAFSV